MFQFRENKEHGHTNVDDRRKSTESISGISLPSHTIVRAKLEMTSSGDADEMEAETVASEIMSGGVIRRQISSGTSSSGIAVPSRMGAFLNSASNGGTPLPGSLKSAMESKFGYDFSRVRIHNGPEAARASRSIRARAFTYGNDIYFNQGQFNPYTQDGQKLVAHELVHVIQNRPAIRRKEEDPDAENDNPGQNFESFPTYCGDFSRASKANLDKFIRKFNTEIEKFRRFADGTSLRQMSEPTEIPDIGPLLAAGEKFLKVKDRNGNFTSSLRCENDKSYRIDTVNPEVQEYLLKQISRTDANLFYLWMKYSPERLSTFSRLGREYGYHWLAGAFGFNEFPSSDFVKHYYSLHMVSSVGANVGIVFVGAGVRKETYIISYRNNLGLSWSMKSSRTVGGGSVGIGKFELDFGGKTATNDETCSADTGEWSRWFSPYDFAHSNVSFDVEAGGHAGFFGDASASGSIIIVNVPGKDSLWFNASGTCSSVGTQVGIGASIGGKISTGFGDGEVTKASTDSIKDSIVSKNYEATRERMEVARSIMYFETGSDRIDSETYGPDNMGSLNYLVKTLGRIYAGNPDRNVFKGVEIEITGLASPMWKYGKNGSEKNLALSRQRANAAQQALEMLIESQYQNHSSAASVSDISYQCHEDSITGATRLSVSGEGDKEGLEETGDINNNDELYRSAEIRVFLNLDRIEYGINRISN